MADEPVAAAASDTGVAADGAAAAPKPAPKRRRLELGSEPALSLLECLGVDRAQALAGLADCARAKIIGQLPVLPPRRVMALVSESFAHIDRPELRPVAIAALEHAPQLPAPVIEELYGPKRDLLETLPLPVRQRVWEAEQPQKKLFLKETHAQIIVLTAEGAAHFARAALCETAEVPPRQRRAESSALQRLVELVGPCEPLYRAVRELYQETFNQTGKLDEKLVIAGMRCDLLMAVRELDDARRPVLEWDPSHQLVCCLDAALREGKLEPRALQIMLAHAVAAGVPRATPIGRAGAPEPAPLPAPPDAFFEQAAASASLARAEVATALGSLPCVQLLARTAFARLEELVGRCVVPAADELMVELAQLLSVAANSSLLGNSKLSIDVARWSATIVEKYTLRVALPLLAEALADDRMHLMRARHAERTGAGGAATGRTEEAAPLPAEFAAVVPKHARHLFLLYTLRRVEAADQARVLALLPLAASLGKELAAHPDFVGGLVSALLADPARRLRGQPAIASAVVLDCLLPLSALLPHAHTQLRRLMLAQWQTLHAMEPPRPEGADDLAGIGGILRKQTAADSPAGAGRGGGGGGGGGGGARGKLSILQVAAREANEFGVVGDAGGATDDEANADYAKLARLVPGLLGTPAPAAAVSSSTAPLCVDVQAAAGR